MSTRQHAAAHQHPARLALAGVAVALAALVGFGGLVDAVTENADLASYDPGITADLVTLRMPGLTFAAEVVTTVGSEAAIGLLTLLAVGWLWFARRDRSAAVLFAVAMAVAGGVTLGVKHLLERHRPPAAFVLGPVDTGYSFPSGHTVFSTVFLGLLAALVVWPRVADRGLGWRVATVGAWVLGSVAIGVTRVYLGYHWTTDVVAGWALGVAVLATMLTAGSVLRSRSTRTGKPLSGPRVRETVLTTDGTEGADHASPAR